MFFFSESKALEKRIAKLEKLLEVVFFVFWTILYFLECCILT